MAEGTLLYDGADPDGRIFGYLRGFTDPLFLSDFTGDVTTVTAIDDSNGLTLTGGAGTDHLYGSAGDDTLNGGAGNDYLYSSAGDDTLTGGAGRDYLYGSAGDDTLTGEDGDDRLHGGVGADTLTGGLERISSSPILPRRWIAPTGSLISPVMRRVTRFLWVQHIQTATPSGSAV